MKKIFTTCLILIIVGVINASAQSSTDLEFVFKTYLFINSKNISNSPIPKRDLNFFEYFIKNTTIKLDTLNSKGFSKRFVFLSLKPSNISHSDNIDIGNYCESYKLAVDKESGKAFRLGGFDVNDFEYFYNYLKDLYLVYTNNHKTFFKHYKVDDIYFPCLFQSIKNHKYDPIKYPCSRRCSDLLKIN